MRRGVFINSVSFCEYHLDMYFTLGYFLKNKIEEKLQEGMFKDIPLKCEYFGYLGTEEFKLNDHKSLCQAIRKVECKSTAAVYVKLVKLVDGIIKNPTQEEIEMQAHETAERIYNKLIEAKRKCNQ